MRAIENANGPILRVARIEMDTDRKHLIENIHRRLHVRHAGLVCPGAVSREIDALLSRHRQVLVPDHLPVRVGSLVEEEGTDCEAGVTENSASELSQRRRRSKR